MLAALGRSAATTFEAAVVNSRTIPRGLKRNTHLAALINTLEKTTGGDIGLVQCALRSWAERNTVKKGKGATA